MGRFSILLGLCMAGFFVGFIGYLLQASVSGYLLQIFADAEAIRAVMSGMAGSFLSLMSLIVWERVSKR